MKGLILAIACALVATALVATGLVAPAAAEDETADKLGPERKRPPRAKILRALAKHLAKEHEDVRRLLTPETCKVKHASDKAVVMRCFKRGCADACQVIEASAELRFHANNTTSAHKVRLGRLGDTGQCGHCMY